MENYHYLIRVMPELIRHTVINPRLLAKFEGMNIFNRSDIDSLECESDPLRRNYRFWSILRTRYIGWKEVIEIFKENDQFAVASILSFGITEYPLDIRVKKREVLPGEYFVYSDDAYGVDPDNIGLALLINITEFNEARMNYFNRKETNQDLEYMKELWEQMEYEVSSYECSFTAEDINLIVSEFLDTFTRKRTPGSCVVFIGSHGDLDNITLSDGSKIRLCEDFICKFYNHPVLHKKPKLFFVNTTPYFPETELDELKFQDTLICFCNFRIRADLNFLERYLPSFFIRTLAQVFMQNADEMEVGSLLDMVFGEIFAAKSIPGLNPSTKFYYRSELKSLYFNLVQKAHSI